MNSHTAGAKTADAASMSRGTALLEALHGFDAKFIQAVEDL
jgi:hypothetical protein